MRIFTIALAALLFPLSLSAQVASLDALFDKYSHQENFDYQYIDADYLQDAFPVCQDAEAVERVEREDKFSNMLEQFEGLSVLIWHGDEAGKPTRLYEEASGVIRADSEYEELLAISGDELSVRGLIRESSPGVISELVVVARETDNYVLVQLQGNLELSKAFQYTKLLSELHYTEEEEVEASVKIPSEGITSVEIWPNPSAAQFNVQYHLTEAANMQYMVLDATGRIVYQSTNELIPAGTHTRTWTAPGTGLYTLVMQTGSQRASYRLVSTR